jgi:hypothetical protein
VRRRPWATDEDLSWLAVRWTTPPEVAQMTADFDRVVSI